MLWLPTHHIASITYPLGRWHLLFFPFNVPLHDTAPMSSGGGGRCGVMNLCSIRRTEYSDPGHIAPLRSDIVYPCAGIKQAVRDHSPKMLFLTSPNNPDGSLITEAELLDLLQLPVLVVLDEAYIEFSGEESRLGWVAKYENLVVLRTFSKSAGLAGACIAALLRRESELVFVSPRYCRVCAALHLM